MPADSRFVTLTSLLFIGSDQSQSVPAWVWCGTIGRQSDEELGGSFSAFATEETGRQWVFDIEEAIGLAFSFLRNDDVGDLYAVDSQRSLTTLISCSESAEDSKTVSIGGCVKERVLYISATLCVAIGLVAE